MIIIILISMPHLYAQKFELSYHFYSHFEIIDTFMFDKNYVVPGKHNTTSLTRTARKKLKYRVIRLS